MEEIQSAHREEQNRLDETLAEIDRQLEGIGPRYYGDDFLEQVLDARREETRERLTLLRAEPYFGRLDYMAEGREQAVPLYIGKRGMDAAAGAPAGDEPYIIDWRAPIASLFYSFTGGEEAVVYEAPDGPMTGEVLLKRSLSIRASVLERVVDSYVRGGDNLGLSDEFLLYRLGEKKDNRLRDIVSTIQAEQDRIIRAPRQLAMIIQGAAGSGKTTVALHRLAYLLYHYQDRMRAEKMIIFAPNAMFLDYISGVLPELGVGSVRQTTFADWALSVLGDGVRLASGAHAEDRQWFAAGGERAAAHSLTPGRFKGSLAFKQWLDERLRAYEANYLPEQPFEPWDGLTLPFADIRGWFETEYRPYPLAARRERLAARLNRWLEMQLNEIADPKRRKERAKTGKQRLRAYLKRLPETDAPAFYGRLFGAGKGTGRSGAAEADGSVPKAIVEQTRRSLSAGTVLPEDLAPLVWIHRAFHGADGQSFDHVVVDEAQDASPFQIALLGSYMSEPSFTILGDLAQGIHAYRGIHRWEELTALFREEQVAYHELRQSYRSTLEIIAFANRILPHTGTGLPLAQPVFRSGEQVEVVRLTAPAERAAWIRGYVAGATADGMRTVAVIGRSDDDCAALHAELRAAGLDASLIAAGQHAYAGGVSVVPVYMAKGLEFDAVVLADADSARYAATPEDAKLLYVGCTRALHRLALVHAGEVTPLIAEPS